MEFKDGVYCVTDAKHGQKTVRYLRRGGKWTHIRTGGVWDPMIGVPPSPVSLTKERPPRKPLQSWNDVFKLCTWPPMFLNGVSRKGDSHGS